MEVFMRHGAVLHASTLKVGDVVRPLHGSLVPTPGAEALFFPDDVDKSIAERRRVESTRGWRNPPVGGPDDFRQGFDVTTVSKVTVDTVHFVRPYLHVNADGTLGAVGVEQWDCSRENGGHWYELL